MFARVTISQLHPDKVEGGIRLLQESIIPAIKQAKGFKGLLSLGDRPTGKAITIALWETEADLHASIGVLQEQMAKSAPFFMGTPSVETYEVIAQVEAP